MSERKDGKKQKSDVGSRKRKGETDQANSQQKTMKNFYSVNGELFVVTCSKYFFCKVNCRINR